MELCLLLKQGTQILCGVSEKAPPQSSSQKRVNSYRAIHPVPHFAPLAKPLLKELLAAVVNKMRLHLTDIMDLRINNRDQPVLNRRKPRPGEEAFTLVEVMVVMLLLTMLIVASGAGIMAMDRSSRRLADYTAAMAVAEAKMHSIRAASYLPPTSPFKTNTVYLTNSSSIALANAGTNFLVSGTVLSKIQPVAAGHLVTVTATFQEPNQSFSVTLQSVVNRYSGGEQ